MRRVLTWLLGAAAVAGCSSAEPEGEGGGPGGGGFSLPVEVATAVVDTVVDAISATGEIEALQSIMLRPEVDGRIQEIRFREGSVVQAGEPLFKVDDAELVAQVARAEAERDLARQTLERTRKLVRDNASSAADLEQAEATFRSSEAQFQLLSVRLDRTVVRAPFRGVVGSRQVSLGDYVTTSTQLVSLQTFNPQRAVFKIPERFAQRLEAGQEIVFRVASLPGREFKGVVEFIDPVVELPARVFTVKARVNNNDRDLYPGMFIEVRLATEVRPSAVIVPEESVVPLQGLTIVWVVGPEGTVERREVQLGVRTPGFVEVRTGVSADEQVVVGGQERLQPGMPVMPIPVDRRPVGGTEGPPSTGSAPAPGPDAGAADSGDGGGGGD